MDISELVDLLRPASIEVFKGTGKLCLSSNYLQKINNILEENETEDCNSTFNVLQNSMITSTTLIRDVQFLNDLIKRTKSLKIVPDLESTADPLNIAHFVNLKELDIKDIQIEDVVGLQKIRSQLQEIICIHAVKELANLFKKCGGDNSTSQSSWNELKTLRLAHNGITELDDSFDRTPLLNHVDLSHNQIKNVDINQLQSLKHLNVSFNLLESVPQFRGQICSRLQILILKNNFIEDITGLSTLINLVQLDLGFNCLLDHNSLVSISHLASLQWLNLQGNPLSHHPHHRKKTCNYLNKNTATLIFILDNKPLSKSEKMRTGSLHPMQPPPAIMTTSSNSSDLCTSMSSERPRRVRNVTIEDENAPDLITTVDKIVEKEKTTSSAHLEIKKQVEQLREEFGTSWLNKHSGLLVQDVLGIEKNEDKQPLLSSTPYESALTSFDSLTETVNEQPITRNVITVEVEIEKNEIESNEKKDEPKTVSTIYESANDASIFKNNENDNVSDMSDGEELEGEESIFLANIPNENDAVLVVLTQNHISERDSTTGKKRARWHVSHITSCEIVEDPGNIVKLEFNTVKRDKKHRIYELDANEIKNFYYFIQDCMQSVQPEAKKIYQCMKCSHIFEGVDKIQTISEDKTNIECSKCGSNLVVENN